MYANGDPYATDTSRVRHLNRVTVSQAAERLGITQDAVRQRIRRDTIRHDKDENGRVYVYLDSTHTDHDGVQNGVHDGVRDNAGTRDPYRDELIEELRNRVRYLEEESRRKDSILLTMAQRIPELEAASEPRGEPVRNSESSSNGDYVPPEQEPRSWWRRLFEG